MSVVLGIDIGTSSLAALVYDPAAAEVLSIHRAPNDSTLETGDGRSEQDAQRIVAIAQDLLTLATASLAVPVRGFVCTGQMHGVLLVDEKLHPLTPLVTWQDQRTTEMIPDLRERARQSGAAQHGCDLHPGYMGATLAWYSKQERLPPGAFRACFIADYVGAALCGAESAADLVTDPTHAASSGLFDLDAGSWDASTVDALDIPMHLLPPIRSSGSPLDAARSGAIRGARRGAPIGDNQASVLGSAGTATPIGTTVVNIGTGSQISVVSPPPPDGSSMNPSIETRPYLTDQVLRVGASLNGGAAYELLGAFFSSAGIRGDILQWMNLRAGAAPPHCDGLVCKPHFYGERGREDIRGELLGLSSANLTPSNLCRAVLEGMIEELRELRNQIKVPTTRLLGSGNGIRRNEVLQWILSESFGMDLEISPGDEEAALGAALLAARIAEGN